MGTNEPSANDRTASDGGIRIGRDNGIQRARRFRWCFEMIGLLERGDFVGIDKIVR